MTGSVSSVEGSGPTDLPVIGIDSKWFDVIHVTAMSVLSLSTTVSSILLCYFCCCSRHHHRTTTTRTVDEQPLPKSQVRNTDEKYVLDGNSYPAMESTSVSWITDGQPCYSSSQLEYSYSLASIDEISRRGGTCGRAQTVNSTISSTTELHRVANGDPSRTKHKKQTFWDWNVGERLVVYLAICDFGMSTSHILDHAYIYHVRGHPLDVACTVMALFLQEFIFSQWIVVLFTAVSACVLVVLGKKLELGRWDYRLLLSAFGVPLIIGIFGANFHLLGQSGAWCIFDLRYPAGQIYSQCVSIIQIVSFVVITLAYATIWVKISRTTKRLGSSGADRYRNTVKIMLVFVAVFIFQWWSLVMSNIWFLVETPPPWAITITVTLVNMGGIYNLVAYTIIRRRLQHKNKDAAKKLAVVPISEES